MAYRQYILVGYHQFFVMFTTAQGIRHWHECEFNLFICAFAVCDMEKDRFISERVALGSSVN